MKYCESCHTANKDRARYCRGCKGRFSGVRFAANTTATAFPDSLEILSAPPVPTRTLNRESESRHGGARKHTGRWVLFLVLLLGAFSYWYANQFPAGWSIIENKISSLPSLSSLWQSSEPDKVVIIETPVQSAVSAASQPSFTAPAPAPTPAPAAPRRRSEDMAVKSNGGGERANDTTNAFEKERKAARSVPVERVQPPVVMNSAFEDPAPAPSEALTVIVPAPERIVPPDPKSKECSEALVALALCPK